ncbi:lipoprotein [Psychrobacillus sp. BM2]|uniref:lipoprotein n=1 Tax=Psychrobacillus sp. BM2 TaxID=3400421 RepID=UPI003B0295AE
MKKIILLTVMAIILTGCNGLPTSTFSQPEGKVIVNGEKYTMMPNDFEWKEDNIEIKDISSSDTYELADNFKTLEVEKSEILNFEIGKNPSSITITKLNEDGTIENVEMKDYEITIPFKEGYYIYELKVIWDKGKETFVFDVEVK